MLHREHLAPATHNYNSAPSYDARTPSASPDPKRRRATVLTAHQSGMTCRQISAALGMSKSRVAQLLVQARRDVIQTQRATVARALTARLAAEDARRAALRPTCPLQAELMIRRALAAWSAHGRERT